MTNTQTWPINPKDAMICIAQAFAKDEGLPPGDELKVIILGPEDFYVSYQQEIPVCMGLFTSKEWVKVPARLLKVKETRQGRVNLYAHLPGKVFRVNVPKPKAS